MSDNELDADLLELAGDGSDDEGELDTAVPSAAPSPTPEPKQSVEQEEDASATRKGVAQKVRAKGRRKRRQQSDDDDEISSPALSRASSAMGRSSSDRDAPASPLHDDDRPLYPLEGKFLSSSDKAEIMAMPEIKREEILAERAQEVTKKQQDMQLKKALAAAQAAGNKANKRKAAAAELEEGGRRTTRPRAEKVPTALDKYKAAREQKGADRGRPDAAQGRKGDKSPSSASDRDADGESDVEYADGPSERRPDEPPASLREFELTRIGRSNFAKVNFYPRFETLVQGCFTRINIGVKRETGENEYRMAQIKEISTGKPYKLEGNGYAFTTDQHVTVQQGDDTKTFPLSHCSDAKFTPAELDRFLEHLRKQNKKPPTRTYLKQRLDDINTLLNKELWSDQDVTDRLQKRAAMERKYDPVHALKLKRDAILRRKAAAEERDDFDEMDKCQAELQELNSSNGAAKPKTPAKMTTQERLAQVNMMNRGKNSRDVRNALLEEKRKLKAAREAELKAMAEREAAKKEAEEKKNKLLAVPGDMKDLFGEGSDASRAGTPAAGTPKRSRAATPLNGVKKEKGPFGALRRKPSDDEILAEMDLGIDIVI